jgi:hypothetical protein
MKIQEDGPRQMMKNKRVYDCIVMPPNLCLIWAVEKTKIYKHCKAAAKDKRGLLFRAEG